MMKVLKSQPITTSEFIMADTKPLVLKYYDKYATCWVVVAK
jgi:hypothetical protein